MNRFKELRSSLGYSQKEFADILFVNQTAVSQWERGVTTPNSNVLMKICDKYGVSIDYLLGREIKEKPTTVSDDGLSVDEKRIAEKTSRLSPEDQQKVLEYIALLELRDRQ